MSDGSLLSFYSLLSWNAKLV